MKKMYVLAALSTLSLGLNAQVDITNASLTGGNTYNWTKDNEYLLDGLVFLEDGGVLNIEEGTVIKFTPKAEVGNPSALVICRGAKINAIGTVEEPIIFTAEADDVEDALDLGPSDNMLWGGLVVLGKAYTEKNGNNEVNVEGIPTTEPGGVYGMPTGQAVNNDNSGTLQYVSIRHCGRELTTGSELNGLTLGAVGSATTIDNVEIYASSDDGIEFFGGTVNVKHAIVAFAEDDSYDWDESWTGNGQFWFSIQRADVADAGYEMDGSTPDDSGIPSNPQVYNVTHIGSGVGAAANNPVGFLFRAGTKGLLANSIMSETKGKGIEVQDKPSNTTTDAFAWLQSGDLEIMNNLFFKIGANSTIDTNASSSIIRFTSGSLTGNKQLIADELIASDNEVVASTETLFRGISRDQDMLLDPRPADGSAALTSTLAPLPSGSFFTTVDYKGAFDPDSTYSWIRDWSTLHKNEHLVQFPPIDTGVGITEFGSNLVVSIYPNPTNNTFTVSLSSTQDVSIDIVNIHGQVVKSIATGISGNIQRVADVNDLTKGVYVVRITNGMEVHTQRMVIE